jgi:predicted nucleic acid-binding protein
VKTAIDTNAISALWSVEPRVPEISAVLAEAHRLGGLTIAAPVYAELLAYPRMTVDRLNEFLSATRISVDFGLDEDVWQLAGQRFAKHAARRRIARVGQPRRLIADFVIGAQALLHADRLITLDVRHYEQDFPELDIITMK